MATSNKREFTLDVSDIIEEAYERIGSEVRSGYQAQKARRSLNLLFQDWSNRGINLWTVAQKSTTLTAGTADYTLDSYDVDVMEAIVRRDGFDYQLERITREDYMNIPKKGQSGRPTQVYVERKATPVMHLWPTPDSSTDVVVTQRIERMQDVTTLTDDVDAPSRFIPPMVSGLAYYLAMKDAPERMDMMRSIYEADFARASNEDSERGSLRIYPARC